MPCALRKLYRIELLVLAELSWLYAEELREFKTELKLEKLCDADGVVCTHGEVGMGRLVGETALGGKTSFIFFSKREPPPKKVAEMARTKRAARMATGMRAPRITSPYKEFSEIKRNSSGRTYEPVDNQLVICDKLTTLQRVHPRDFVQVTHSEAPERFWVQVVKHKDGVVWGIVDNPLIFVDWPQGKKIRFSMCRIFDVYAGEA